MTREQARALFPRALDSELAADEQAAFEQALAGDEELQREFSQLRAVQHAASALRAASPTIDLLGSVQHKLRARSGGRFYRDRFAERRGRGGLLIWTLAGSFVMLLLGVLWLGVRSGLLGR
jgi:anti-sigma factor RsiW